MSASLAAYILARILGRNTPGSTGDPRIPTDQYHGTLTPGSGRDAFGRHFTERISTLQSNTIAFNRQRNVVSSPPPKPPTKPTETNIVSGGPTTKRGLRL